MGNSGSNLDTDTYNITYYTTSPIKDDTKFLDTIIGFGSLNSDILTMLDGKKLIAQRTGNQLYGTLRIKDEIKKDNFINNNFTLFVLFFSEPCHKAPFITITSPALPKILCSFLYFLLGRA